jgi:hypothetical protein
MEVTIYAEDGIHWHRWRLPAFLSGLREIGIRAKVTSQRTRQDGNPAILFGTTLWRDIEAAPGDWLLVDRASYGDPDYVQLVWNGHGRRGDHCVPALYDASRWEANPLPLLPEKPAGEYRVICGQTEPYCPQWPTMEAWYETLDATHFRPHPAGQAWKLPIKRDLVNSTAITLNSSIAVPCVIGGIFTEVHDEGGMAHGIWERWGNDRAAWAHWLAWTQWRWDEIAAGEPIRHLFDRVA